MNVAYTDEYRLYRRQRERDFLPEYLVSVLEKTTAVGEGYSVHTRVYIRETEDAVLLNGSENELIDNAGAVCFSWRNIDRSGEFYYCFRHADGERYFLFRQDLYGYSVLRLSDKAVFHYIPAQSFPADRTDFAETFIWTDAAYDPESNLLAVSGCFWACPYSVMIVDFSAPFAVNEICTDIHEVIDGGYTMYDDADFLRWNKGLLIRVERSDGGGAEEITIPYGKLQ